ncbi:transcriptional regulator, LacI family [Pelagirhabdus alkalitolerans]|uniref:Transcriptional regulator, LacI family n=1 Tax=Pelagirhabdus alkalitolerans TaxID=1612202 RepID=A0A1G6JZT6_9BACI|nr:LacI family DNA-binding transcriptional regulator [Pelagirhabdus alkalitolerans]SDC24250.1 transcriptional regulator, LacI family [Pelagirhabdus alkalitolerans]
MTTIYDIAELSGYSITTVSKVLNDYPNVSQKAKKKVMQAVDELGYTPNSSARTLVTNKSWLIGVVFSENLGVGIAHPFFSEVIESFKKHVELYNFDLLFLSRNRGLEQETFNHLKHRGVDGVVVVQAFGDNMVNIDESPFPIVFIDLPVDRPSSVHSDNRHGSKLAVDHLVDLGHKKIAHIMGEQTVFAADERIKGFKKAMESHNLAIPETYMVSGGYFSYEGGREAMIKLLANQDKPTAVVVSGDMMAIGAMKVIEEAGLKVPDDISIIGFDDIAIAKHTNPPLTTIKQDKELIGRQAAIMLLDKMNGETKQYTKVVPVQLIKRGSCRAL